MTPDEKRLEALEKAVQRFNIISSGNNQVQGGFPEFKPKSSIDERISHLEALHKNFTIRGSANVTVEGSFEHGFAICSTCPDCGEVSAPTPIVPPGPPSTPTGACCVGEICSITTESHCVSIGGIYHGNNTPCLPNPCVGACCIGFDCTIKTESDCLGMGGTYQGNGTDCDPSPCGTPPPPCGGCGIHSFDPEVNAYFFHRELHVTENKTVTGPDGFSCHESSDFTTTYDNTDCANLFTCTGFIHWDSSDPPFEIDESWVPDGFGTGCVRSPLDTIPGCLGDCNGIANFIPPWPDDPSPPWNITPTQITLHYSDSGSNEEGYSWNCTADWVETLSVECTF